MANIKHGTKPGKVAPVRNDLNFPTCKRPRKDESNLIARLALAGHTVHLLKDETYLVCKWGYTHHASDINSLKAFAVRLGVCHA